MGFTVRHAVRVLLLDERDHVLLLRTVDPVTGDEFWFPPGGGVEPGEDAHAAARREVAEETGLASLELGAEVWRRRHVFSWRGHRFDQRERWFLAHVRRFEPSGGALTEAEKEELREWRW